MYGDVQTVTRPRFYRLRLMWRIVRWIALAVYWLFAGILCLYGMALIAMNILMIVLPLLAWYHGEPWGDTGVHPLLISAIATAVFAVLIGTDYAVRKIKALMAPRSVRQAPTPTAEKRPTRLAA